MTVSNIDCGACPNITDGCHDVCQKSAQKKPKPVRRWGANWHMEMMYEMHNGPYVRSADFNIERRERKAAQSELAALREELASRNEVIAMKAREVVEAQTAVTGWAAKCKAAEQRNVELIECAEELADLVEASLDGDYKADSFTTQPIRNALANLKPTESGASE